MVSPRVIASAVVLAFIGGLEAYEAVFLLLAAVGSVAGVVAIVWLFFLSRDVRRIQTNQSERIEDLPPPPGG